jgi:hypothetical protein
MKWVTREGFCGQVACPGLSGDSLTVRRVHLCPKRYSPSTIKRDPLRYERGKFGHHGNKCSFEAFMEKYNIQDPALEKIQLIVREVDTHTENPSHLLLHLMNL